MKLWLLNNLKPGYDHVVGFVIAADSEEDAREIANSDPADEGKIWNDPNKVTCKLIGNSINNDMGVVFTSFRAG